MGKLKGLKVLVTGANRGLGRCIVQVLSEAGAVVVGTSRKPYDYGDKELNEHCISGVDVTDTDSMKKMAQALAERPMLKDAGFDVVITNAGYFYGPVERVTDGSLNYDEEMKMIDICAVGTLKTVEVLFAGGLVRKGSRVAIITSQAGSITWRREQNPHGDNYGHHASRAAGNIMAVLLAYELRDLEIPVYLLHP